MNAAPLLVALSALTLGATGYLVVTLPKSPPEDRVAALEKELAAADERAKSVEALRADVKDLREHLDRRLAQADRRAAPEPPREVAAKAEPAAASASADGAGKAVQSVEDAIAERIEKKIAERMDAHAVAHEKDRGEDGKWKPPVEDLAKELKLTDEQKAAVTKIFDNGHDQSFALLKTMRLDGGSLLDDFVATLKGSQDAGEATRQLFERIKTENVPGADQTYLAQIISIHQDVQSQLAQKLSKDQMRRLGALNVELLEVKTGHDPVGDYVRARLQ